MCGSPGSIVLPSTAFRRTERGTFSPVGLCPSRPVVGIDVAKSWRDLPVFKPDRFGPSVVVVVEVGVSGGGWCDVGGFHGVLLSWERAGPRKIDAKSQH